jgi:hypothetical protein
VLSDEDYVAAVLHFCRQRHLRKRGTEQQQQQQQQQQQRDETRRRLSGPKHFAPALAGQLHKSVFVLLLTVGHVSLQRCWLWLPMQPRTLQLADRSTSLPVGLMRIATSEQFSAPGFILLRLDLTS